MNITLRRPTLKDKDQVLAYKASFLRDGDLLAGTAYLETTDTYEEWLLNCQNNEDPLKLPKGRVQATTLLAFNDDDTLVGIIDIRHTLNDYLLQYAGHIGYSVLKDYRRQGVATAILQQGLDFCRDLGLDRILITCNQNNEASRRTILKHGGIFENEVREGEALVQRYWINL